MGRMLVIEKQKQIGYLEYEEPVLKSNEVRLEMLYSGISAGTQLTLYRGTNSMVDKRFDQDLRIYLDRIAGDTEHPALYPAAGCWGYEEVGKVSETGSEVSKVKPGDIVYAQCGHRSTAVFTEDYAEKNLLPDGLEPKVGVFAQIGAIALNAILDADIHVGENVAVFGQGVPGQIVTQLAKLNGATVFAVDKDESRLAMSKKLGADFTLNPNNCDAALQIKKMTGRGVDKSIEISGFSDALHEAIRATIYNGIVVCAGFIVGPATKLCLGDEFHINRITVISSQIEDVNRSVSNAWNFIRKQQTIMKLAQSGKLDLISLISNIIPFNKAAEAYHLLDTSRECMQVILEF